ncbi:MAG: LTA synthase family protein [Fusicatenibacter sp.]|nr:LTA synthase family protein [Fusicatenibacter sp.]
MKKINGKNFNLGKAAQICNWISLPLQALGCCVLYLVIEAISRHSFAEAWTYMTERPLVFLYNAFLIFTTFIIVYLFRRRSLVRLILTSFWLILGIINGVILANRVTPFTGPDLRNLSDGTKVVTKYLSPGMLLLVAAALVLLVGLLVWFWFKGPKYQGKLRWYVNIPLVAVTVALFVGATNLAVEKRILSSYFVNIAFAYEDYGYPYCLAVTLFDTGISEPNGYSEQLVDQIINSEGSKPEDTSEYPNLIFLQLESFFDPTEVNFLNLSEDPIPYWHQLMKEYSSGYFRVPVVGAGTANTEFETITGMSLHYFGPGEYPYKSILAEETCESAPYVLKDLGYATHAIHNNEANFYARRTVFSRLGFDTFTSEEYMPDISDVTETGWVKDHILTDEIIKTLDSTEERDYIYTISVQGHGDYPTEPVLDNPLITVTGAEDREKNNYSWEYYIQQIHEMDEFVRELTSTLSRYPEPVVLVMYGDHLPTMGLKMEDLENRYLYQTQYVIWDNMGLEREEENIASYQMAAEVMDRVGIHEGTIFRYHQTRRNTKNYQVDLEVLQYDMLYGKRYVYGLDGETPYERVDLTMGVVPITLDEIRETGNGDVYFYGQNFTESSRVEVNEEMKETIFLGTDTLLVRDLEIKDGDSITIAQQSNSSTKKVLTRSDPLIYRKVAEATPTPTPNPDPTQEDVKADSAATWTTVTDPAQNRQE